MRSRLAAALALLLASCGGDVAPRPPPVPAPGPAPAPGPPPAPTPPRDRAVRPDASGLLRVEVGDTIAFPFDRIEVRSGARVRIELVHTGRMPRAVMGHNLVILQPGADLIAFSLAAALARDHDFVPPDLADQVLAHSGLVGGGETTAFELVAPEPGEYEFLCSFPGHSAIMRGVLVARAAD